ncbi:hypothetical protein PsorP6_004697 [Peronosclerospora sorghi]|uniref:Uncharacterized protein n=1 Tax=Peronosclerospora sorghi TaxID=230839 RepID=A0ACC0VL96_9STRA|nr:hypothetical protein PsorP6_004697 [Peronosclerospora sorghi]
MITIKHANRTLQDQLKRSADIINGLQNEVTMFRQMCLNLQAEVSCYHPCRRFASDSSHRMTHTYAIHPHRCRYFAPPMPPH